MDPALRTAATGMAAQQTRTEVIAHNLANVNTTGFKRSRANFEDLLYQTVQGPQVVGREDANTLPAIQVGRGVRLAHAGGNAFVPPADRTPAEPGARDVRQGSVEESNVSTVGSLVEMITVQRAYASVQKAMTTLDGARGIMTGELGKPV